MGSPSHFRAADAINTSTPVAFVGGTAPAVASTTHVYAAVPASKAIAQFNFATGQLTSMSVPQVVAAQVDSVASDFFGRHIFSAAPQTLQPNMYDFTGDPQTGALTAVPNAYSLTLQVPELIAADREGNFVYTTDSFAPEDLWAFGRMNGPLVGFSPSISTLGHTSSLALDPFTRFILVANGDQNSISGYDIQTTNGAPSSNLFVASSYPTGSKPVFVYVEPLGRFAYVAN